MATLMQIRAALEDGQARGLKQLSRQVDAPPALVEAILERLIALGKVERVAAQARAVAAVVARAAPSAIRARNRSRIPPALDGKAQSPPRQAWRALCWLARSARVG